MKEAMNRTRQARKQDTQDLTYAITKARQEEIRQFVDTVHARTGQPKGHIVSELLIEGIRRAKNFYQI